MKTAYELWDKLKAVELVQVRPIEMDAMIQTVKGIKKPVIVEIGSAHGASSIIFAETVKDKGGKLFCIDNYPEDYYGQEKFGKYARQAFMQNVMKPYSKYVTFLEYPSSEAIIRVRELTDGEIDLLFIDGDHSYEAVREDCELYLPLLRSGGHVGFHDYNNPAFGGVKRAADAACGTWGEARKFWDLTIFRKP